MLHGVVMQESFPNKKQTDGIPPLPPSPAFHLDGMERHRQGDAIDVPWDCLSP
jgi:hypothetical protein